ncbi:hypothetical protein L6164_025736 [Bauhinia variegata]|uniref:Uncharacterized protein n=1 Tax=Bauhinia variegata TaxID=167791 RepID=A0ACB9M1C4_BAUVA|nr:hypothetical protein L6164_025736 [Bauhinia variegata]
MECHFRLNIYSQKAQILGSTEKGFGKVSMGNEMGNNNTSALKEEDNTTEAEKKAFNEDFHAYNGKDESQTTPVAKGKDADTKAAGLASSDTRELQNQTSQEDIRADGVKGENHTIETVEAKDVILKAAPASDDAIVAGKDTLQEVSQEDDVKGKDQLIPTRETEDVHDKAKEMVSENPSAVENDSLEGDTLAGDLKVENQIPATTEAEDVQEEVEGRASDNTTTLERDSLEGDTCAGDVKFEDHMYPTAELKDTQEEAIELASDEKTTTIEKDSLEGDTDPDYMRVENQKNPTVEAEDVQEKATALPTDNKASSLREDSLEGDVDTDDANIEQLMHLKDEGKNVEGKAARLTLDYATRELQDHKSQEDTHANDKQGEINLIPTNEGIDVTGRATCLDSDDPLNVTDSSGRALEETTGVKQADISHCTGSVEAGVQDGEILPHPFLERTEEFEKQNDSIKQVPTEEEQTMILTLDDMSRPNDAELQESSDMHSNHNELVNIRSEPSLLGSELLQRSEILDKYPHCEKDDDDVSEKKMETQEKKCGDKFDGFDVDEFGGGLRDTSAITSDSANVGEKSNAVLLARVNYITDEVLNLLSESAMVDMPVDFDQWKNSKVLYVEKKATRGGSKMENGYHYNPGQCYEEPAKEKPDTTITGDTTRGYDGDFNEERNLVLLPRSTGIGNTHQVTEPKVMESGYKIDVHVNNHSKTSDEISTVSQVFIAPGAEVDPLITGSTVLDCRYKEGVQIQKTIIEENNQKPEASYDRGKSFEGREISGQCNSNLVSIDKPKSLAVDTSASFIHIYSYQQGNVNHTKAFFTGTDMATSDLKEPNDQSFGTTFDKLDSSNLTAPDLQLVDGEEFQKEDCSQSIEEATSSKGAEISASAAILSNEACSSISAFSNCGYEANESITRLSTESNSDNPNVPVLIQKSPSFNLNLRIEARSEESDHMPLLNQDKTEIESLSSQTNLNIMNSNLHAENGHCMLQREETPVEEKVVTMERSYSLKSNSPFLGLLKEDEEARLLVTSQKEVNHVGTEKAVKEIRSTSPKAEVLIWRNIHLAA